MANIAGTQFADFIHRAGDGNPPPGGFNVIDTVTTVSDTINAGAGDDIVFADNGNDTVNGEDGNDTITGGQGDDNLNGGIGNDTFRFRGVSDIDGISETINGGNDVDSLDFQTFSAFGAADLSLASIISVERLFVSGNELTFTAAQLGAFTTLSGTGLIERLFLSAAGVVNLTNAAIGGIDEFRGTAGDDTFTLTGVALGQTVNSLGGIDDISGSLGGDLIDAGTGNDTVDGDDGNDQITGGTGTDALDGGDGNDILTGGAHLDTQTGRQGNDIFRIQFVSDISGQAEIIDGGTEIDTLDFQALDARGAVNLSLATLTGLEILQLQGNEATMTAAQIGAFLTIGGTGLFERITLSAAGNADLTGANVAGIDEFRGSAGNDTINLTDVALAQTVDGRAGNDTLRGSLAADLLTGNTGNDTVIANQGNDIILGGQGTDNLQGGDGNDVFRIQGVSEINGLAEQVNGGNDTDALDFQSFNAFGIVNLATVTFSGVETLSLSGNDVRLTAAQTGAFVTIGGTGLFERITLSAAGVVDLTGANVVGIDEFRGTTGNDTFTFTGALQGQTVNGLGNNDSLTGGDGNDVLNGGDGTDTLKGNAGADVLTGGLGRDTMTGGGNADLFDFNDATESVATGARDVIADFVQGQDVIQLADIDANSTVAGNQAFNFIGGAAFGAAGDLRYAGGILSADIDGDGTADFQIGLTGAPVVLVSDLVL